MHNERHAHEWAAFSRSSTYAPDLALPLSSAKIVRRHMGVSKATLVTPYSVDRFASLQPGRGALLYRDGVQMFSGTVADLELGWDLKAARPVIRLGCVGDEQHFADRLSFPDPLRAPTDQTVNDYWRTRDAAGLEIAVPASTAMMKLISDQAGPTCIADRQVPGLILGDEPGVGVSRVWSALYGRVMDELALMSIASGRNLGLRVTSAAGSLTADIVVPRDVSGAIRFSGDLRNLGAFTYSTSAPTATHVLVAGQGDLRNRVRRLAVATDPETLAWERQVWDYQDRRDTADVTDLETTANDAVTEGGPTVSLALTLRDSEATVYGRDWDVGDRVTVYVGMGGQEKPVVIEDIVREVMFEVDSKGRETLTPAVGSYEATAVKTTATQRILTDVRRSLAGLIRRK